MPSILMKYLILGKLKSFITNQGMQKDFLDDNLG